MASARALTSAGHDRLRAKSARAPGPAASIAAHSRHLQTKTKGEGSLPQEAIPGDLCSLGSARASYVFYAMRDGDKTLRAQRAARSPEWTFCAHRLIYAYRFDRHS
jgi:hypothetical protein